MNSLVYLIPALVIFIIGLGVAIVKYVNLKKTAQDISILAFINEYSDNLIKLCKDCLTEIFNSEDYKNIMEEDGITDEDIEFFINLIIDKGYERLINECESYNIKYDYIKILSADNIKQLLSSIIEIYKDKILDTKKIEANKEKTEEESDDSDIVEKEYNI